MPASNSVRRASASAPGTCGELAQGMLDGTICMVTCPIDLYSRATVELSPGDGLVAGPADSPKASRAVTATLAFMGEANVDARLLLDSPLPRGKGMASSTADVSAAIVATASAAGRELSPTQIAEIALSIEPSDGVMFPGIHIFDHRKGLVIRDLGKPPPLWVEVLEFEGTVDTLEFNSVDRECALTRLEPEMGKAVSLIEDGIRRCDPVRIGQGATLSAIANQQVLPKPHFDAVLEFSRNVGAVGVNVAHSGTVIGLLFADDRTLAENAASLAGEHLEGLVSARCVRLVGGGVSSS